jgi:hypothetical protein
MNHLLPTACEQCLAECIERTTSKRFSGSGTESTEYKCGARYHRYASHREKTITQACPQSPAEKKKAARREQIDRAVANALNSVRATYQECEEFPKRMERDKGWSLRADEGIWNHLHAKRPREGDGDK